MVLKCVRPVSGCSSLGNEPEHQEFMVAMEDKGNEKFVDLLVSLITIGRCHNLGGLEVITGHGDMLDTTQTHVPEFDH